MQHAAALAAHARATPPARALAVGALTLDPQARAIIGPRGSVRPSTQVFDLAIRLVARPGEPVRNVPLEVVKQLRAVLAALSGGRVRVVNEPGIGHRIEAVR